jgi:hypothetical protein
MSQDRNQNQGGQGQGQQDVRNQDRPNQNANKEQAEGSRENVRAGNAGEQGGGITNRPLDREEDEQAQVPPRGQTKDEERGNA